ncbi:hypothetical protein ACZ90_01065 [Streptomyces albus subsp. albus]|nr:hypothetical protein ACZ90_01065 [Streptomyces albus subsp. albus]
MAVRNITAPRHPEAAGAIINGIARYGAGLPAGTKIDDAVVKAFASLPNGRQVAQRMTQNFQRLPKAQRAKAYGELGFVGAVNLGNVRVDQILKNLKPVVKLRRDDVGPAQPPPPNPTDFFTLSFTGIYCRDETDWDRFSNSDEAYVITSVVQVVDGDNVVRTEKHPVSQVEYGDLDSGEWRTGPIAACWAGREDEISLVTAFFERDEGNPNAYREEIHAIVKLAALAAEAWAGVSVPIAVQELAEDLIVALIGSADDLIETDYRVIGGPAMRLYAATPVAAYRNTRMAIKPNFSIAQEPVVTDIPHHFATSHKGGGAEYFTCFRFTKETRAIPVVPMAVATPVGP